MHQMHEEVTRQVASDGDLVAPLVTLFLVVVVVVFDNTALFEVRPRWIIPRRRGSAFASARRFSGIVRWHTGAAVVSVCRSG
jgi:hypothetical protein